MTESIYVRKSTVLIVAILMSIVLLGTTISFIVWISYDKNYGIGEIVIRKDQDFVNRYEFPGSGTLNDPYLIVDYILDTSKDYAIYITGTTKHFLITNCTIKCQQDGIFIGYTAERSARIENNEILGTSYSTYYLIKITQSQGTYIVNNHLSHSYDDSYSNGISLSYSENSLIANNSCYNVNNGIHASESNSILIEFNYIDTCSVGIRLSDCKTSIIMYNNLFYNSFLGVELHHCVGSIIHHNNLINNAIDYYYESQAYDTENNHWYDMTSNEGNYWSDLIWDDDVTYLIQGSGSNIDLYPLQFPVLI